MKNELLNQSKEILELLKQSIISGKEIAVEHLPEICQQLIRFEIFKNAFVLLLCILVLVTCLIILKISIKYLKANIYSEWVGGIVASIIFGMFSIIGIIFNTISLIKIIIAPKVFLIENIMSLFL
jgi:hypothetical protein